MLSISSGKAGVLWTGGKDCALACHIAAQEGYAIDSLVTFVPKSRDFKAHSLELIEMQATAMGLPIRMPEIAEPYDEGYKTAICSLRDDYSLDALVTGDIAEVDGHPNWIRQCCEGTGVKVLTPLWGVSRAELANQLLGLGFQVILTCVKKPWLDESWLGRELTAQSVSELQEIGLQNDLDLCGENGEYHSLVLDAPMFKQRIVLDDVSHHKADGMMWLQPNAASLWAKH